MSPKNSKVGGLSERGVCQYEINSPYYCLKSGNIGCLGHLKHVATLDYVSKLQIEVIRDNVEMEVFTAFEWPLDFEKLVPGPLPAKVKISILEVSGHSFKAYSLPLPSAYTIEEANNKLNPLGWALFPDYPSSHKLWHLILRGYGAEISDLVTPLPVEVTTEYVSWHTYKISLINITNLHLDTMTHIMSVFTFDQTYKLMLNPNDLDIYYRLSGLVGNPKIIAKYFTEITESLSNVTLREGRGLGSDEIGLILQATIDIYKLRLQQKV